MSARVDMTRDFAATLVGNLRNPLIAGKTPFKLSKATNGMDYTAIAGYRSSMVSLNVGLRNPELLSALSPEVLVHFVPWADDMPGMPHAYINRKTVVAEAAWPAEQQEVEIPLTSAISIAPGGPPLDGHLLPVGKSNGNTTITLHSESIVHLLTAGTTDSGKSWTMRLLACLFAFGNLRPHGRRTQSVYLDGKGGQGLGILNGLPGQVGPVAISEPEWINALGWVVQEIDRRYAVMLAEKTEDLAFGTDAFPEVIVVADEFHTFTENARSPAVTALFDHVALKGRAAHVKIIAGTHKPSLVAFGRPGNATRDMFDATIGLHTPTATASRLIRGDDMCQVLLGKGDAMVSAKQPDGTFIDERCQLLHIPTAQLRRYTGGEPLLREYPQYDISGFMGSAPGRPETQFTDEQVALSIHGAHQSRPWGRGRLQDALSTAGCGIAGTEPARRLLQMGRNVAEQLDELGFCEAENDNLTD